MTRMDDFQWWWRRRERILNWTGRTAKWALGDWFLFDEVLKTFGLASLKTERSLVFHMGLHRIGTWSLLAAHAARWRRVGNGRRSRRRGSGRCLRTKGRL